MPLGLGLRDLSFGGEPCGIQEIRFRVLSCLNAWARTQHRLEGTREYLDKEKTPRGQRGKGTRQVPFEKAKAGVLTPRRRTQPLSASPSGSLSLSSVPFSPPLLPSLLVTLAPSHNADSPGPTRSPWSDHNRRTHVLMSPPTGLP